MITTQINESKDAPSCEIFVEGMGLCGSEGDDSAIYLEYYNGKWWLRVWADINQEDPTHSIDMSGALRSSRVKYVPSMVQHGWIVKDLNGNLVAEGFKDLNSAKNWIADT